MSLFPETTLSAASSSSTVSTTWAALMARSATVFEVTTSGKLSGRSVAFSGFLAMTVAVATYAGFDMRVRTPIAAVASVAKSSGIQARRRRTPQKALSTMTLRPGSATCQCAA